MKQKHKSNLTKLEVFKILGKVILFYFNVAKSFFVWLILKRKHFDQKECRNLEVNAVIQVC